MKPVLQGLGVEGLARIADLCPNRSCRLSVSLAYIDGSGDPMVFRSEARIGDIALAPAGHKSVDIWDELWRVLIPGGLSAPVAALPSSERRRFTSTETSTSVYAQFAAWLRSDL